MSIKTNEKEKNVFLYIGKIFAKQSSQWLEITKRDYTASLMTVGA